jgi:2-polyprenyl-3-methyl-5-hydroxy-6-metoxy-1,4-benzoquinol methylase
MDQPISTSAAHWDEMAATHQIAIQRLWLSHPDIQRRMNRLVSGNPEVGPFPWFVQRLRELGVKLPVRHLISIGSGTGELERGLATLGVADRITAFDVSPEAVRIATEKAAAVKLSDIQYRCADLNTSSLGHMEADVAVANMSIHHVENLELLFSGLRTALSGFGGYLMFNEYIGPMRFQFGTVQLELLNRLSKSLPAILRSEPSGHVRSLVQKPLWADMVRIDPSEAVRSSEILDICKLHFDIVELRPWRGALLHFLLTDIVGNFVGNPVREGYVELLSEVEDILTESGMLQNDFAVVLARVKP